ncbi:unnamed protein product [Lupinus luteus]|uniref:Uncharacterized protein n=1 Tax=Lupinus luteus TaxID=3873 RepID=A0AAV1YFN5_LUPLU
MPNVKYFWNPLKSAPQSQCASSPIEDPTHSSSTINHTDPSPSVQALSQVTHDTTPPVHSLQAIDVSTPEVPKEVETLTDHVGRESTYYSVVEAIGTSVMFTW